MNDALSDPIKPLLQCPDCSLEMRLFGVEAQDPQRDLYTFECYACGRLEVRGVLVTVPNRPGETTA